MVSRGMVRLGRCRFWLLDINYEVKDHEPQVWIWGVDDEGRRVLIIDSSLEPYFYALLDENAYPEEVCTRIMNERAKLPLLLRAIPEQKRLFGEPVKAVKIYCRDPDVISKYARVISKLEGVRECLETDIRYSMRYLIDYDVTPSAWHEVEVEEGGDLNVQVDKVYIARSPPKRIEMNDLPKLRILSFFPVYYASKGSPKPERDPIVIIATAANNGENRIFTASEYEDRDLLRSFIDYVKSLDPDVIVGYQTNQRHWQYLMDRAKTLGLDLIVDRAGTWPHRSVYGHISITGRASIDMFDFADELPELKVKTLENMIDILGVKSLEEQKIIDEIEHSDFWDDKERRGELIEYAAEKANCILKALMEMLIYAVELSRLVGLPLDHIGKAAVGFRIEWYLIREAHRIGELIPERTEKPYMPYAGGMVLKPKPGIHENVCVLDFKSMYPNIMIEKNVSPDTYVPPSMPEPKSGVNVAPEVGHKFRKEPPGFYKRVLTQLISARNEIRSEMKNLDPKSLDYQLLDARQKAVKVITNAAYGYAGWIGARWFRKPVAEATAAWGRSMIMRSIEIAKDLGLEIVYGDTDSLFIKYKPEKVDMLVKRISDELGLEIRPEKIYRRILFTEAKKRYCGLLPNGTLDNVGLEVVRGDWANVAKITQERVLEMILKENSVEGAVEFVRGLINDLRRHKIPFRDLIIWKTLTMPVEKYKVNAPHVEAARILKRMGWNLTAGDQIGYVVIQGSGRLYERVKPYALATYDEIDVEYYVKKQIVPAALRVLSMFGVKEKNLISAPTSIRPKTLTDFFEAGKA